MNEFNNEEIRVLESKDKLRRLQTRLGGRLRLVGSQKLVKFQHHIREGALTKVHGKGRRCAPCHLALLTEELVYSRPKDNKCAPSHPGAVVTSRLWEAVGFGLSSPVSTKSTQGVSSPAGVLDADTQASESCVAAGIGAAW